MSVPSGNFTVNFQGLEELKQRLDKLNKAMSNTGTLMGEIAEALMLASNRAFDAKKDPATGQAWPERCPQYVAHLLKLGKAENNLLQQTGHLRASRQTFHTDTTGGVGTNLVYARIHQLGGYAHPKTQRYYIPARPFIGADERFNKWLQLKVNRFIENALNK